MAVLLSAVGTKLPRGYSDALRQLGLFAVATLLYETVRGLAEGRSSLAFANAERLIEIQRATGTFFEPAMQEFFIASSAVVSFANFLYINTHFALTAGFLVWLYLRRNESFYFIRNMFMVAMAMALVGYALMPTAPPRLLPEYGFVDTINVYASVNHDSALARAFVNPYAAVPSMHCAFALMIGIPGALLARARWAKLAWALYPILIFWVVIVTGNHFWLDGAAGAFVAGSSALIAARALAPLRPNHWGWHSAPGEVRA